MLQYSFANLTAYLLVLARLAGMLGLNPVFSRRNVPAKVRAALIMGMTLILGPVVGAGADLSGMGGFDFLMAAMRELAIGAVCAFIFQLFYYLLFFAGDMMDMQFGLSMARVFDPSTNVQSSISGNLISILFLLYFFATDSHLIFIRLMYESFNLLPVGQFALNPGIATAMLELFISAFSLMLRLVIPFVAVEMILELSMGILMKLIPQIHVFVINIQLKILFGVALLFAFAGPIAGFVDKYLSTMMLSINDALKVIGNM